MAAEQTQRALGNHRIGWFPGARFRQCSAAIASCRNNGKIAKVTRARPCRISFNTLPKTIPSVFPLFGIKVPFVFQ